MILFQPNNFIHSLLSVLHIFRRIVELKQESNEEKERRERKVTLIIIGKKSKIKSSPFP